jgi:hypothetical protein
MTTSTGLDHAAFYFCFYWQEPRLKTRITQAIAFIGNEYRDLTRDAAIAKIEHAKKVLRLRLKLYEEYERRMCMLAI